MSNTESALVQVVKVKIGSSSESYGEYESYIQPVHVAKGILFMGKSNGSISIRNCDTLF